MIAERLEKSMEVEPESPRDSWRVEIDEAGQQWNVAPTGQRLKIGGDQARPGRPKTEVRERWLKLADKASIAWATRILDSDVPDSAPEKLKAVELALRFGLGTSDEVKLDSAQVPQALARVLARHGVAPDLIEAYATDLAKELNLKGA